jgi:predicted NUDIX family phosphoesterase
LSTEAAVLAAAVRELAEEVGPVGTDWTYLGLINDDSDAVGRVHLGVGLIFEVQQSDVTPLDPAIADPEWLTIAELVEREAELESWSRIVVRYLSGGPN